MTSLHGKTDLKFYDGQFIGRILISIFGKKRTLLISSKYHFINSDLYCAVNTAPVLPQSAGGYHHPPFLLFAHSDSAVNGL